MMEIVWEISIVIPSYIIVSALAMVLLLKSIPAVESLGAVAIARYATSSARGKSLNLRHAPNKVFKLSIVGCLNVNS
jgi:hypothetical protein